MNLSQTSNPTKQLKVFLIETTHRNLIVTASNKKEAMELAKDHFKSRGKQFPNLFCCLELNGTEPICMAISAAPLEKDF